MKEKIFPNGSRFFPSALASKSEMAPECTEIVFLSPEIGPHIPLGESLASINSHSCSSLFINSLQSDSEHHALLGLLGNCGRKTAGLLGKTKKSLSPVL